MRGIAGRWCRPSVLVAVALALVATLVGPLPASAGPATLVGSDISWPQCGGPLPATPAFGIVGVNDGRPDTANPCLASEDAWASASGTAMFYMNTANPGVPDSQAYAYGWDAAQWAYQYANSLVAAGSPHVWWLDVETANSWLGSTAANTLDLEGSLAFFAAKKVPVGIYSTTYQWQIITGGARIPSVLDWVPGASSAASAPAFCSASSSFSGGPVFMAQYTTQFDYDLLCPGVAVPTSSGPPSNVLAALLNGLIAWLKKL